MPRTRNRWKSFQADSYNPRFAFAYPHTLEDQRMASSVEDKVKQIIVEQLGVDEGEVTATASFIDDLGADSLDIVELVMALEEGFGMEIPDEDAEKITTVKDAINYIESHMPKS